MRAGRCPRETTRRSLVRPEAWTGARVRRLMLLAAALVGSSATPTTAQPAPIAFRIEQIEDPRPSDLLFAQSWPDLIEENNRESARLFPSLKPAPGHNSALSLTVARVPIPAGEAVISIYTGPFPHCQGVGEIHNSDPLAIACPGRLTIVKYGAARTINLGMVCRVGPVTNSSRALAFYDPQANAIRLSAMVNGRLVDFAGDGVACGRVIPLSHSGGP